MTLREKIEGEIRRRGSIPFSRYMELCLFDSEFGYYSRSTEQFGKTGDFYTASDVHAVFARLLARQFEEMWRALGSPERLNLVELGPGRGLFARDVLDWSGKKFPDFFQALHYVLVESSASLRAKLRITLGGHLQQGKAEITSKAPKCLGSEPTICFGNEFFDAFPVEIITTAGLLHLGENNGRLAEIFCPILPYVQEYLDRYSVQPDAGERIEAGLSAARAMEALAAEVRHGFLVFVDYGYTQQEQIAGRHRGTVMAYREHRLVAILTKLLASRILRQACEFHCASAAAEAGM